MFLDSEAITDAIVDELGAIGQDWIELAEKWLEEHDTNYIGTTRENLYAEVLEGVDRIILQAGAANQYALWVHEGRGPGRRPPFINIYGWVRIKLGIVDEKEARSVAWAIVNKIAQKGTKAQPFLRETLEELLPDIPGRIERAVANALETG